ncbi:ABC transporter permease [Agrobacterium genomosp. 13]|uniref:ABC transporter, membrane spanning protein n=1 Tax=Agrobacterium genomosp. 13 str. CFBP 6927 TaxID=1183428 RepID=A0ABM9VKY4_9HYPH
MFSKVIGAVKGQAHTVGSLVGAGIVWEIAVRLLNVPEYILPAPSKVFADLYNNVPIVFTASLYTLQPMVLGFLVAVVMGTLLALLVVYSRAFEAIFYPLLVILQIIPKIAIAPLFIIWVGFGLPSKILLVFCSPFFRSSSIPSWPSNPLSRMSTILPKAIAPDA